MTWLEAKASNCCGEASGLTTLPQQAPFGVVQCSARAVQCSAVQCEGSAVQCSAVQCSAVQCSAVQCEGRAQWITGQGTAVQCALHLSLCLDQSAPMIKEYGPNHWHGSAPARDKAVLHVMREEQDKKKKKKKAHVESAKEEGQKKGEEGRKEKEKKREKEKEKAERPLKSAVKRAKKEQVDDEMCRGSNNPVPCPGPRQGLTYTAPRRAAWHCTCTGPQRSALLCPALPCSARYRTRACAGAHLLAR